MYGWNESAWFSIFTGAALKSTAVLGVAWLLAVVMRARSAAARHLVWTAGAAVVLALPFLSLLLPALRMPPVAALLPTSAGVMFQAASAASRDVPTTKPVLHGAPSVPPNSAPWRSLDWKVWIMLLWAGGTASAFAQMLMASAAVGRIRRTARAFAERDLCDSLARMLGICYRVDVLETPAGTMPMTSGILQTAVFIPSDAAAWTAERRRVVLLHELAHVRRGDVATHLLARTALMLYWWNPLAWKAWREFLKERERAADDLVLNAGTRASEYAGHLLDVARSLQCSPAIRCAAVAMARRSQLEGRLLAILDAGVNRRAPGRVWAVVAALVTISIAAPLAAVKAQDTGVHANQAQAIPADVDATIRAATSQRNYEMLENAAEAAKRLRKHDTAQQLLRAAAAIRAEVFGRQSAEYGMGLLKLADLEQKRHVKNSSEELYTQAAQALGERPEAARALLYLGAAALLNKDFARAIDEFQHAQRVDPTHAGQALMWMAIVRQTEQKAEEAETLFKRALSVQDPKSTEAFTTMKLYAQFLRQQDRAGEAGELESRNAAAQKENAVTHPAGMYTVGSASVTPPKVQTKVEPEYTDEARAAKLYGTQVVVVEIGVDGLAHNARVVQSLGLGLDENGVDAIRQWQFRPAMKDGQPVPVSATIEINWRLM